MTLGKRDLYLDESGADEIKQLILEKIFSGKSIEEASLTPYTIFELFESLAKQSKFPLPYSSGKGIEKRYDYPRTLPQDMQRSGYDAKDYYNALDILLNRENREVGRSYVSHGMHGHATRGFTPVNVIPEEVLGKMLDWMAGQLQDKEIKLPKLPKNISDPFANIPRRADSKYEDKDGKLKQAFCQGLGIDPATCEENFLHLFRRVLKGANVPIIYQYPHTYENAAGCPVSTHKIFGTTVFEMFHPKEAGELNYTALGHKGRRINQAINSALYDGNYLYLLDEELVFQIGCALRKIQYALPTSIASKITNLSPIPPITIGQLTVSLIPDIAQHERVASSGESYTLVIQGDGNEMEKKIVLPPQETADDLFASLRNRMGRYKPDKIGRHVVETAIDEYLRQQQR